jgi:hypothetical protein
MHRLIYTSYAAAPLADEDLAALLRKARCRNAARGVTGVLFYANEQIVQVLEGNPKTLEALFAQLLHDPRHHGVTRLSYKRTARRHFAEWAMASYTGAPAHAAPLWGYPAPDRLGQRLLALSKLEGPLFQVLLNLVGATPPVLAPPCHAPEPAVLRRSRLVPYCWNGSPGTGSFPVPSFAR